MKLSLVKPSSNFKDSYLAYVDEIRVAKEAGVPFVINTKFKDFNNFVSDLNAYSKGERLESGFVPHSTFWLMENDTEIVGVSNMRHKLTDRLRIEGGHIGYGVRPSKRGNGYGTQILAKSLLEAKKIGIEKALITCAKTNLASAKVILNNGGVLENEDFVKEQNTVIQRYWITV